jgi:nucleobase:cation symporter-1, NCS1 family
VIFNVGDWGWLIGASAGALIYVALAGQRSSVRTAHAEG